MRFCGAIRQTLVALAAGVGCGALLVAAYIYSSVGEPLVFGGLFEIALLYGAAVAVVCVPVWLALTLSGWDRAFPAAALGFAATAIFFALTYASGSHERMGLMAYTILPYALCGAVAALVTWWIGWMLRRT